MNPARSRHCKGEEGSRIATGAKPWEGENRRPRDLVASLLSQDIHSRLPNSRCPSAEKVCWCEPTPFLAQARGFFVQRHRPMTSAWHARRRPSHSFRLLALLLGCSTGALCPRSAFAQAGGAPAYETVVTATPAAEETPREDSAASCSVVTQDRTPRAAESVPQLLSEQAGAVVTRLGGMGSTATVSLRGFDGQSGAGLRGWGALQHRYRWRRRSRRYSDWRCGTHRDLSRHEPDWLRGFGHWWRGFHHDGDAQGQPRRERGRRWIVWYLLRKHAGRLAPWAISPLQRPPRPDQRRRFPVCGHARHNLDHKRRQGRPPPQQQSAPARRDGAGGAGHGS